MALMPAVVLVGGLAYGPEAATEDECEGIYLFIDDSHSACTYWGPPTTMFDVWIWVKPRNLDVLSTAFKIEYSGNLVRTGYVGNPNIGLESGSLETGYSATFLFCQADWFWVGKMTFMPLTSSPGEIRVVSHPDPGIDTIQVTSCIAPYPTRPVLGGQLWFNTLGRYCLPPDFIVSSGTPTVSPDPAVAGQPVTFSSWTVRNEGCGDVLDFSNGYYLSADSTITASDIFLGAAGTVTYLSVEAETTFAETALTIPPETAAGDYYIGVLPDNGYEIRELDEDNNFISTPITIIDPAWTDVTSGPLGDSGRSSGVAWGDYDGDRDQDLYLPIGGGNANKLLRNEGGGTFVDATSGPLGDTGNGTGVAWGDYDNDGDLDLYLANFGTSNKLFRNDGGGTFADTTRSPLGDTGAGFGVAWADYDGDGDLDLYLANWGVSNKLFRNNLSTADGWLHVDLEGVYSNRAGIGARVRIVTGGTSQMREISGGSGYASQNSLTAEFGLGVATTVDSVQVIWPSGIIQDSLNVAVDQLILITEQDVLTGVGDRDEALAAYSLYQCYPNPFNPFTRITFSVAVPGGVALRIYDISGRPIRTLVDGWRDAERYEVAWDGRDDTGNAVASGVYFYQLEAPGHTEAKKMVLLR
jgi:hypothetical protein